VLTETLVRLAKLLCPKLEKFLYQTTRWPEEWIGKAEDLDQETLVVMYCDWSDDTSETCSNYVFVQKSGQKLLQRNAKNHWPPNQ